MNLNENGHNFDTNIVIVPICFSQQHSEQFRVTVLPVRRKTSFSTPTDNGKHSVIGFLLLPVQTQTLFRLPSRDKRCHVVQQSVLDPSVVRVSMPYSPKSRQHPKQASKELKSSTETWRIWQTSILKNDWKTMALQRRRQKLTPARRVKAISYELLRT